MHSQETNSHSTQEKRTVYRQEWIRRLPMQNTHGYRAWSGTGAIMRIRLWDIFSIVLMIVWCSFLRISWGQALVLVDFSKAQNTVPPGWELLVNKGNAQLQLVSEAHSQALQLRSEAASFALQKKIHIALQDKPFLVWQW